MPTSWRWPRPLAGQDREGYRAEFLDLVRAADSLSGEKRVSVTR